MGRAPEPPPVSRTLKLSGNGVPSNPMLFTENAP
jgi:hypothetical protein